MGKDSSIEYCHNTFNAWVGCTKVSPGCQNCFAEAFMTRKPRWENSWGVDGVRMRTTNDYWKQPLSWDLDAQVTEERYRVLCGSLCDVFEDNIQVTQWRSHLIQLIQDTPNLDWLLLTKRPEEALKAIEVWDKWGVWPDNAWMGVSVENQEVADERIPILLEIPAKVRFVSVEPMLSPIDLSYFYYFQLDADGFTSYPKFIDWVILGAETGPNQRYMNPDWARDVRDWCKSAHVSFFMKQMSRREPIPDDLMIREYPKEDKSDPHP